MASKLRRTVTDEQIIASYQETHSVFVTARALGIGSTTAHRVLRRHGVPLVGLQEWRKKITKFRGQENEIRAAYETGMTHDALRQQFGEASDYAFKHAIRRAGGTLRENPAPLVKLGEIEAIRQMNADGLSQVDISLKIGRSQSFVSRLMRQHKIAPQVAKYSQHGMWKGGRLKDGSGYIRILLQDDDPFICMCMNSRYVLEHRLVMARKLKRPLLRSETVHHVNGDRADNRPENLELRQGKHGKHVVMCCLDCGSHNIGHSNLS